MDTNGDIEQKSLEDLQPLPGVDILGKQQDLSYFQRKLALEGKR